jgi:hypothetical protein
VAELGEGDDRASVNRVIGGRLDGGPGSDTLSGAVAMTGGAGDDRLHYFATNYCRETLDGGDGADILDAGGDGVSTLGRPNRNDCGILDGGAGPDVFRGGGLVSYTSRTEPVTVTSTGSPTTAPPLRATRS